MGTFHYQWFQHEVAANYCTRCGEPIVGEGTICLRVNQRTGAIDMKYTGGLLWATPCTPKGHTA